MLPGIITPAENCRVDMIIVCIENGRPKAARSFSWICRLHFLECHYILYAARKMNTGVLPKRRLRGERDNVPKPFEPVRRKISALDNASVGKIPCCSDA